MVRVRPTIPEEEVNNIPLSPFNGIKDFDDSWPVFIDEEEEGVKSLKDCCLFVVDRYFRRLKEPLKELPITLQMDVLQYKY
jgi:hypothetical protein